MKYIAFLVIIFLVMSCGGQSSNDENAEAPDSMIEESGSASGSVQDDSWKSNKGVGPVTEVVFDEPVNEEMAEEGKNLYNVYCLACHKVKENYIGPAPKGIYDRRTPEWVANMIINPEEMLAKDPIAKQLLIEYNNVPMAGMGLNEEQARKILEYFRTIE